MHQPLTPRPSRAMPLLLLGVVALVAVVVLGLLAKTTQVTHLDLRVDEVVRTARSPFATSLFVALTAAASEVVGILALLVGVVVLVLRGRRWDAFRLAAMAGSAWVLAIGIKILVARPRPPASLWAITPDATGSFPSGHDTTACVVVVVALMALTGTVRARGWATGAAVLFALAVGGSRVYLGDHYPTDVLGSWLTVTAAALLVAGICRLDAVQAIGRRVLRDPATRIRSRPVEAVPR